MSDKYTSHKVNALPATLLPNAVYFIADPVDATRMSIAITTSDGSGYRLLSSGGTTTIPSSTVITNTQLSAVTQDVVLNTSLGPFEMVLPQVASDVEIRVFYHTGTHQVTISKDASDADDILLGQNSITCDQVYDTVVLKAIGGKWFAI
jgi:hypothetical protein